MLIMYLDTMSPKKKARRDVVVTGGVPPSPTDVQMGKKGPKRTRKQSEIDTVNVIPNIDYELLAKEIINQQKASNENPNIGESVGQPIMVNSVEDIASVFEQSTPAAATIPSSALGSLLNNVFTGEPAGNLTQSSTFACHSNSQIHLSDCVPLGASVSSNLKNLEQ